jgi:hypothetical protein
MKKKMALTLVTAIVIFGLLYLTNELLTRVIEWWTIPILCIGWLIGIMGLMLVFDMTTESDDTKGEEDRRKGRWND